MPGGAERLGASKPTWQDSMHTEVAACHQHLGTHACTLQTHETAARHEREERDLDSPLLHLDLVKGLEKSGAVIPGAHLQPEQHKTASATHEEG